jgi:hypothetical protein
MPAETRYMRSDTWTVNGLSAYKLGLEQTTTEVKVDVSSDAPMWGIRVWKRSAAGVETEITGGTPVAIVVRTATDSGIQSNTWSCPETSLNPTDAIVVRVYIFDGENWQLAATFITEQLNASKLNAATWTVYYYTVYSTYLLKASFYFGTSHYNSRIENFQWTPAPVGQYYVIGDGLANAVIFV